VVEKDLFLRSKIKNCPEIAYYETLINRKKNDVAAVGQLGILSVLKKRKTES